VKHLVENLAAREEVSHSRMRRRNCQRQNPGTARERNRVIGARGGGVSQRDLKATRYVCFARPEACLNGGQGDMSLLATRKPP